MDAVRWTGALGKRAVIALAVLCVAAMAYGYWRHPLWDPNFWPGDSLGKLLGFAAAYAVGCAVIGSVPRLRRCHRQLFVALAALMVLGGAGAGGLAAPLFVLAAAMAAGSLLLGAASAPRRDEWSRILVATVVGLCPLSLAIWGAAHFRINLPIVHAALLAIPIVCGRKHLIEFARMLRDWLADGEQAQVRPLPYALGCLGVGFMLLHLNLAMWPEVTFDAITHHLRFITTVEWQRYYDFDVRNHLLNVLPYLADSLFLATHLLGGEAAARLLNAMFFLLALGIIWNLVRSCCSASTAWLATALFASTPLCICTSFGLFSDNALTLAAMGLWLGLVWLPRTDSPRWDAGVAMLMALPILLKFYGLFLALAAALAWMVLLVRRGQAHAWRRIAWVGILAILAASPPYLYAWTATGNPVFPFKNSVFGSPFYPPADFADNRWTGHLDWTVLYKMTFHSTQFCEVVPGVLGLQYLLLVPCAMAVWLVVRNRVTAVGLLMAVLFAGGVLSMIQYTRYLLPAFAFAVVLGVIALDEAARTSRWRWGGLLLAGLCALNLALLPSGLWALRGMELTTPYTAKAKDAFLRRCAPGRLVTQCINTLDGDASRVAFLGTPYAAGLRGTPFFHEGKHPVFYEDMIRVDSERSLHDLIAKWGLTHFVWDPGFNHPRRDLIETALGKRALWRHEIGGVTVVRVDPAASWAEKPPREIPTNAEKPSQELLTNTELLCPIKYPWHFDRLDMAPPGQRGVRLRPNGTLVQRIDGHWEGQVRMSVDVSGGSDKTNVARLQIRWFLAGSREIPVWSEAKPVRGSKVQTVQATATVPQKAVAAEVYVVHQSGADPLAVHRVSLQR